MKKFLSIFTLFLLAFLVGCSKENDSESTTEALTLVSITNGTQSNVEIFTNVNPNLSIDLSFADKIDSSTVRYITLKSVDNKNINLKYIVSGKNVTVKSDSVLSSYSTYKLTLGSGLKSVNQATFSSKTYSLQTALDSTDKFSRISDEDLLTLVQEQTFKYFWDFGHPTSGMARERSSSGNTVTTGGTGFGIMAIIVAIERGFISREEALTRIQTIVNFLDTKCTKYHGAFSHWINGETGATIPFSTYDDGADLVETSFLFQGLLTAQQYFNQSTEAETQLRSQIDTLWRAVEWTWFQKDHENVLYWHWSATYGWQMNQKITGWNEALIVYVLAGSSPTYPISKDVYTQGWAQNGTIENGNTFYGYQLSLGNNYGGPLFFTHYSFLGLNPKKLKDNYANYWTQNQNHSLINYSYCVANPNSYTGYSSDCWGLTASDGNSGYRAYSPTNDKGVIAPTAALSSMPYTPDQSMNALRFFYYKLGDKIWKEYGFVDAFNPSHQWFDTESLAIDQGPIIVMIENYRSGKIWHTFMTNSYVLNGLNRLGFTVSE